MGQVKQSKHTSKRTRLATGVGVGTALLAGMMATTATAADGNTIDLSEVSVNADKQAPVVGDYHTEQQQSPRFTQPISDTPQTVQVISKDLMDDQHATTLSEALRNSAGVGTFHAGENGATNMGDAIQMRGFDASSSIYVDGVRNFGSISRDMFNVEQVEVIKGPNSTNYGRTTPGGSINLVTKQAQLGNRGDIMLSGGTADYQRSTLDVNRQLGDSTAARLNAMWQSNDTAGRDKVDNKHWGIAPSISFGLGTDTRVKLSYLHMEQDDTPDGGVPTIGLSQYENSDYPKLNLAPAPDSENFYGSAKDHDDVQVDQATLIFEQDFGTNKTLRNVTRWGRIDQSYLQSNPYAKTKPSHGTTVITTGNVDGWKIGRRQASKDNTSKIISNQTGIVQKFATGSAAHTLSYGLAFTREKVETRGLKSAGYRDVSIYHPAFHEPSYQSVRTGKDTQSTIGTAAIYLFDTVKFADAWQLNAGARLDHYSLTQETTGKADQSVSDNLFSWQLGALYHITDNGNVYVNYAIASQPPGSEKLELARHGLKADYDPLKSKTAEVGTKWTFADNRLLLTAAVYQTKVENVVQKVANVDVQTAEKRIRGIELGAVGQITRNWNVSMGFATLDTTERQVGKDEDLSFAPDASFTSWTIYRLPFGLELGGGARYMAGYNIPEDSAFVGKTDGYWVVDAMASYPVTKHLDVQLNVYNVTNKDYIASINRAGQRYVPGEDRTAILGVNYTF